MTSSTPKDYPEKRSNGLLRLLVDEMLEHVREVHRHAGPWPAEERAQAEEALSRIMTQVKEAAATGGSSKSST
ncbi:MAG: hypothetical protein ABI877_05220 [Gemmatimonadaceae bacterium]